MDWIRFEVPSMPYYIVSGREREQSGYSHISRKNSGVFDIIIVCKGCLFMGEEEQKFSVQPGDMFILRPDLFHFAYSPCMSDVEFYWIHFQTEGKWSSFKDFDDSGESLQPMTVADERSAIQFRGMYEDRRPFYLQFPQFSSLESHQVICKQIDELIESGTFSHAKARWREQIVFNEILSAVSTQFTRRPLSGTAQHVAEKAATFIRQNYSNPLSYPIIGKAVNFNPNYVLRCMKKVYGCTLTEYLNKTRIDHAKLLLINTDFEVSQIAEEVGFSSIHYFSYTFRKSIGISPRDFRKQLRQSEGISL